MHYAIIAAGDGSRLVCEGVKIPKPLVPIQGVPMIERLMRIMAKNNAESISVIVNNGMTEVQHFLQEWSSPENLNRLGIGKFNLVVESTPSSMHSFQQLSKVIDADYVCLTTVDTVFPEHQFAEFIERAENNDGLFAVTPFIDDEKPLYVDVSDDLRVIGFYDQGKYGLVSGGIYCLNTKKAFPILENCIANGISRMRNYQRALLEAGMNIQAYVFPKIMDIDHASDIQKAERFLGAKKFLFINRAEEFSPNNVDKDSRILELTRKKIADHLPFAEMKSVTEDELETLPDLSSYDVVVGMERRLLSLDIVEECKRNVFNCSQGIINVATSRRMTLTLLDKAGINVPQFGTFPAWVKVLRPDGAQQGDVVYVETPQEAESVIKHFESQKVLDIVVTKHIHGDLLKVYAVTDKKCDIQFCRWFYPQETGYTKFGEETANDELHRYAFDDDSLRLMIKDISRVLQLQIFGFDAIINQDGQITVIDVNDWPSYSICQDEAAEAIARTILVDTETC